jgi:hypothetical protein
MSDEIVPWYFAIVAVTPGSSADVEVRADAPVPLSHGTDLRYIHCRTERFRIDANQLFLVELVGGGTVVAAMAVAL